MHCQMALHHFGLQRQLAEEAMRQAEVMSCSFTGEPETADDVVKYAKKAQA